MNTKKTNMNFDHLRLFLAIIVMVGHFGTFGELPRYFSGELAVCFFFCISGFLITESFKNNSSLEDFFTKRLKRIYTPIVIVVFIMEIFGFLTNQAKIWKVGLLNFLVFQDWLPASTINHYDHGAFWTLVVEFQFYLLLPIILICLKKYQGRTTLALFALYFIGISLYSELGSYGVGGALIRQNILNSISFFIAGIITSLNLLSLFENKRRTNRIIPIIALAVIFMHFKDNSKFFDVLYPFAIMALVITIAKLSGYFSKKIFFGDLSYGIYIYHFPVFTILSFIGYSNQLALIGATIILSLLSWHLVEKRILTTKKQK